MPCRKAAEAYSLYFFSMKKEKLAFNGNYQAIRKIYFTWRALVVNKKLTQHYLSDSDRDLLVRIRVKATWRVYEAWSVYNILKKYAKDLKLFDVDFAKLQPPDHQAYTSRKPFGKDIDLKRHIGFREDKFVIRFRWDPALQGVIKTWFASWQRRHDPMFHEWHIDKECARTVAKFADAYFFDISSDALSVIGREDKNFEQSYQVDEIELDHGLKLPLYPYQSVGVDYGHRLGKILNADEMGLGKTVQSLGVVIMRSALPCLIICEKSMRYVWANEIDKFTDQSCVLASKKNARGLEYSLQSGTCDFYITNYEMVRPVFYDKDKQLNHLAALFKSSIIDESHELKNPRTQRFKNIHGVIEHMDTRICATGTPIVNHTNDLIAQLTLIDRIDEFGGADKFRKKYSKLNSKSLENGRVRDNHGRLLEDLNKKLRSICMIRRLKSNVQNELPDKFRTEIPLEISNKKAYDSAQNEFITWLHNHGASNGMINNTLQAEALVKIGYLKKISAQGKIEQFKELVTKILGNSQKVIVFCWHLDIVDMLCEQYSHAVSIDGRVCDEKIQLNKRRFEQDNDCNMIVGTYRKMGKGHTMTAARNVILLEPGWNPMHHDQAEDRSHRVGQKNNVNCYHLIGIDTIDTHIYNIINRKRALINGATDTPEENVNLASQLSQMLLNIQ